MKDKKLSGEESLKLINCIIYQAKVYYYESGISILIYGFSILICTALTYLRYSDKINFPFNPFYLFTPVFFVQAFLQMKEEKKKKAKSMTKFILEAIE